MGRGARDDALRLRAADPAPQPLPPGACRAGGRDRHRPRDRLPRRAPDRALEARGFSPARRRDPRARAGANASRRLRDRARARPGRKRGSRRIGARVRELDRLGGGRSRASGRLHGGLDVPPLDGLRPGPCVGAPSRRFRRRRTRSRRPQPRLRDLVLAPCGTARVSANAVCVPPPEKIPAGCGVSSWITQAS